MKYLIAFFLLTVSFTGSSMTETVSTHNSTVKSELSVGKDRKKSRRHKKTNNRRKRHCAKAARRNFAG